jgi:hypothetical protein
MSDDDQSFLVVSDDDDSLDESSTATDSFAGTDSRGESLDIEAAQQQQQVDIIMSEDEQSFLVVSDDDDSLDERSRATDSFAGTDSRGESLDIEAAQQKQQVDIAGQESVGVSRWRRIVIAALVFTAALVITTTYLFLSREQTDEFEKSVRFEYLYLCRIKRAWTRVRGATTKTKRQQATTDSYISRNTNTFPLYCVQFTHSAKTIIDSARIAARNTMGSLLTLGDSIASEAQARGEALDLNETWPFVTTYDFEVKGAHTRLDSATELVLFAPIVTDKDRARWEKYSVDHQDWLMKSKDQVLQTSTWFGNEFYDEIGSQDESMDAGDSTSAIGIASKIHPMEADESTLQ